MPFIMDELLSSRPSGLLGLDHVSYMLGTSSGANPSPASADNDQSQVYCMTNGKRKRRLSQSGSQGSSPDLPPLMELANRRLSLSSQHPPTVGLPRYIRPLPATIAADDIEWLERKGTLIVPEIGLRNELLRSYVQYVHPYTPVLDLKDFLQPIERNDGTTQISLLLFQAVLFAATAYIDIRSLRELGYESRKAARKVFFHRAKVRENINSRLEGHITDSASCYTTSTTSPIA